MRGFLLNLFGFILLVSLACSDSSGGGRTLADTANGAVTGVQAGATPFVAYVRLELPGLNGLGGLRAVSYTIRPKPGSCSRPVHVSYTRAALEARGFGAAGSSLVSLPVFGLYPGLANAVDLQIQFEDGSSQALAVPIATSPYVDPNGVFDRPVVFRRRAAADSLGFDFFYLKSFIGPPVIFDSDCEIRWVGTGVSDSSASTFLDNGFVVGASNPAPAVCRIELDGGFRQFPLVASTVTAFHHNFDYGKVGLLAEVNTYLSALPNLETTLIEISPSGTVFNQWDFARILGDYMSGQGDDPTSFIRPGIDWFHMNSAIYDASDDSLIVSSREHFVIKIDYASGRILWILGDPTKFWYSFPSLRAKALTLQPGGLYPIGQHALSFTPDGLLMLFNDGLGSLNPPAGASAGASRDYSAVSAYSVDARTASAREVWDFDHGRDLFSDVCSSAASASDRSLLVDYATADSRTHARILGLDPAHATVFDMQFSTSSCSTAWNAQIIPLEGLSFGSQVRPGLATVGQAGAPAGSASFR